MATQASSNRVVALREQGAAADHDAVELRDREAPDLRLQAVARPSHQEPLFFERPDQLDDAGDIGDRRGPDRAVVLLRDLGAHAFRGKELLQQGRRRAGRR